MVWGKSIKIAKRRRGKARSALANGDAPPSRRRQDRAEQDFQIKAVVPYLKAVLDPLRTFWFHVPNGGARSPVEGAILKAMGVRAGLPDIVVLALVELPAPGGDSPVIQWRICMIELKRPDGDGRLSGAQKECYVDLLAIAVVPFLCESLDDVKLALQSDGIPLRPHTIFSTGGYVVPLQDR